MLDKDVSIYEDGRYLAKNPDWHIHESCWKAKQILLLLDRNRLAPKTICDIGCGVGEVLKQLQNHLSDDRFFCGYDISPQAVQLAQRRANDRLHFVLGDFSNVEEGFFDLILVLDVIEHLEDYFSFLRGIKTKGIHKMFHIPLDVSVQTVLRGHALVKRHDMYGHVHYFTKETALLTLTDVGYHVLDYTYTPRSIQFSTTAGEKLLKLPRLALFSLHRDFAARLLGGFSLMVLAD